jgi:phage-related protein
VTQPIDVAYVDVVVRDGDLKKLEKDVERTAKKAEKSFSEDLLDAIDKHFGTTIKKMKKDLDGFADESEKQFKRIDKDAGFAFEHVEKHVSGSIKHARALVGDLAHDIEDFADGSDKKVGLLRRSFTALNGVLGEVGAVFGKIFGVITSHPLIALIVVLTPAIIALAAALSELVGVIGLIPSGILILISVIAPLIIAFQNFGDAVSALVSGDLDKINEAMKKLAPSAQVVAREIAGLVPQLQHLQRVVQQQFFAPLQGAFAALARNLLPALTNGLGTVAASLGRMVRQILDFFGLTENVGRLNALYATTARIIDKLAPNLVKFIEGFFNVAVAALPIFERLFGTVSNLVGRFGDFLTKSAESGDLAKFIEDAVTTFKELLDLVKAVGRLIGTLFAGTREEGHGFIQTLTDLTIRLDNFFKSAAGQEVIHNLVVAVGLLGAALGVILNTLIFLGQAQKSFVNGLVKVEHGVIGFTNAIGEFLGKIPEAIGEALGFLASIPGRIQDIFRQLGEAVLIALGTAIGTVIFIFKNLPEQIANFLLSLPQRIHDILAGAGPAAGSALQDMITFAKNVVVNGFNEIVDFILSVPDRIKALGPIFLQAGLNLIKSFMNGFRSVGSFIGDVAGDIVNAVKGFLNKAIDKINVGIAAVDAFLPGDLPRIPRLAGGALVKKRPGGILANIGEGNEDEVVAPLSKLGDLTGGQTINFGPGSINVSFSGVVPTENEARATGKQVGEGIIAALTRANVRTQVRAI